MNRVFQTEGAGNGQDHGICRPVGVRSGQGPRRTWNALDPQRDRWKKQVSGPQQRTGSPWEHRGLAWGGGEGAPQGVRLGCGLWTTRSKPSQETLMPRWERRDGRERARLLLEAARGARSHSARPSFLGHRRLTSHRLGKGSRAASAGPPHPSGREREATLHLSTPVNAAGLGRPCSGFL